MTLGDPEQPAVDVHYRMDGPAGAPVLVLSHAMGASPAMWDQQVARLSADYRVLRYDQRGHGASPVPAGPYRIGDFGRDLIRLLDRLGLRRISFAGVSLGGMVGLWLAANAPERVDRLVVCSSAARMLRPDDYAARARQVRTNGMASIADTVMARWFTSAFAALRPETIAAMRAIFLSTPPEGYAATCEALAAMDLRDDLPGIAAATLVVAAADDQSTPPEQSRELARRIPGAEFVLIPGTSHLANVERPDAVTDLILGHLGAPR